MSSLRLIVWFAEKVPPVTLVSVSAGADLFGAHSGAIDSEGRAYSWGFGPASGHGSQKLQLEPKELELRVHRSIANYIEDTTDANSDGETEDAVMLMRENDQSEVRWLLRHDATGGRFATLCETWREAFV